MLWLDSHQLIIPVFQVNLSCSDALIYNTIQLLTSISVDMRIKLPEKVIYRIYT